MFEEISAGSLGCVPYTSFVNTDELHQKVRMSIQARTMTRKPDPNFMLH